jgi:hypothetical protein
MKEIPRSMGKRLTNRERQAQEREDAAFALMGTAFVKLLRSAAPEHEEISAKAYDLADWLHLHIFTDEEANEFMTNTGWVFDSDLRLDDRLRDLPALPSTKTKLADGTELDDDIPF